MNAVSLIGVTRQEVGVAQLTQIIRLWRKSCDELKRTIFIKSSNVIVTFYFQAVDVMRSAGKSVRMVVDKCEPSYDAMSDSMTSVRSSQTLGKHKSFFFSCNVFLRDGPLEKWGGFSKRQYIFFFCTPIEIFFLTWWLEIFFLSEIYRPIFQARNLFFLHYAWEDFFS